MCVCAILPLKVIPEMTFIVLGGTLNPTHSLTHYVPIYTAPKSHKRIRAHKCSKPFF